jgi:hypothetical protein
MATIQFDPIGKFKYTKKLHCNEYHSYDDMPAIEYLDGSIKIWYKDGLIHRDNEPAIIAKDLEEYYFEGKLHSYDYNLCRTHILSNKQNTKLNNNIKYYKGVKLIYSEVTHTTNNSDFNFRICCDCGLFNLKKKFNWMTIDKSKIYCDNCKTLVDFKETNITIFMIHYPINDSYYNSLTEVANFITKYTKKITTVSSYKIKNYSCGENDIIVILEVNGKFYIHTCEKHDLKMGKTFISINSLKEITNIDDIISF